MRPPPVPGLSADGNQEGDLTMGTKRLTLYTAWCKGCGICTSICPKNVLELENEKCRIARPKDCVRCRSCVRLCPDYALYFEEVREDD